MTLYFAAIDGLPRRLRVRIVDPLCSQLDRFVNLDIARTATEVPRQRIFNLFARRFFLLFEQRLRGVAHRVVALGTVLICLAAALLSLGSGIVFAAGLTCFLVGFIAIDISLNLHPMDHIPRQEFGRFETVRVLFVGSGFIIGPMAGVWLSQAFGRPAPFIAMAVVTLIVYAVFLYLRFSDNKAIQAAKTSPPNPLKFFPHFFQLQAEVHQHLCRHAFVFAEQAEQQRREHIANAG